LKVLEIESGAIEIEDYEVDCEKMVKEYKDKLKEDK